MVFPLIAAEADFLQIAQAGDGAEGDANPDRRDIGEVEHGFVQHAVLPQKAAVIGKVNIGICIPETQGGLRREAVLFAAQIDLFQLRQEGEGLEGLLGVPGFQAGQVQALRVGFGRDAVGEEDRAVRGGFLFAARSIRLRPRHLRRVGIDAAAAEKREQEKHDTENSGVDPFHP